MPKSMRSRRSKKIKTRKRRKGGLLGFFSRPPPPPPSRWSRLRSSVSGMFGPKTQPLPVAAAAPPPPPPPAGMTGRLMTRLGVSSESQGKMREAAAAATEAAVAAVLNSLSPIERAKAEKVIAVAKAAGKDPMGALRMAGLAAGAAGFFALLAKNSHNGGGQNVRAFNAYNDPSTMHAKPVSGYNTAMPHNWVGGRTRRRR